MDAIENLRCEVLIADYKGLRSLERSAVSMGEYSQVFTIANAYFFPVN
jgi:hypothetical protein